ncbi:hypothetical protein ABT282_07310 [Streptomyces sp. NPDC000927]|uniref:hypothetical protein n=1 Tax=Streptomyces sp. NPDC000927 TaxID=3154371 RepID=UPI00332992F1
MESWAMRDKPHRITQLMDEAGAVIRREPYAGHPSAAVHAYWEEFEREWGFFPRRMDRGEFPFPDRRRFALLNCTPGYSNMPNEFHLLNATMLLVDEFGGVPRVYGYNPQTHNTTDPVGSAMTDPTLNFIVRTRGLDCG